MSVFHGVGAKVVGVGRSRNSDGDKGQGVAEFGSVSEPFDKVEDAVHPQDPLGAGPR